MKKTAYRKSYTGLVIWLILFIAATLGASLLPAEDPAVPIRVLMNICTGGIALLAWIVWRSECVYWYNGVSFEQAENAGSERRRDYAFRHFWLFGVYALAALGFTLAGYLAGWPWWVDMTVISIGLIAAALYTTRYKL